MFLISLFFSPSATGAFFVLGTITWLFSTLKSRSSPFYLNILDKILLLQLVFSFIFYFLHQNNEYSFLILLKDKLRFYLPWFWFRLSFENNYKFKRLSQFAFLGAAFIISLIVFLQVFSLPISKYYLRLSGFQSQPYTTSGLLLISFFLGLSLTQIFARLKNKLWLNLLFISLICQFLALIFISQRAIWLALVTGIIFYAFFNLRKISPKIIFSFFFSIGLTSFMAYLFSAKFKAKLQSFFHLSQDKAGLGCRLEVWKLNWESFLKQPLIGQGQAIKYQCFTDSLGHAHNIFLQQLVLNGLLGFSIWFSFWLAAFHKLGQKFKKNLPFIASLFALLVEGLFENWYGDSEVQTAFFFLLASALTTGQK